MCIIFTERCYKVFWNEIQALMHVVFWSEVRKHRLESESSSGRSFWRMMFVIEEKRLSSHAVHWDSAVDEGWRSWVSLNQRQKAALWVSQQTKVKTERERQQHTHTHTQCLLTSAYRRNATLFWSLTTFNDRKDTEEPPHIPSCQITSHDLKKNKPFALMTK